MATKPKLIVDNKKITVPLIVEPHPDEYTGFPFITLLQYRKQPMLVIVDNADEDVVRAYVLDLCGPEHVDEEVVLRVAVDWYATSRSKYPISVEFSRKGLTSVVSKIYRALNVEFISRAIGPVPKYPIATVKSVKRRRRKPISANVEISTNVVLAEQLFQ